MQEEPDNPALNILVVDDESNIRKTLSIALESHGHRVIAVSNAADAVAEAQRRSFDMAFVDLRLGVEHGLDLIPRLLAQSPWMKIVVITAYASVDTAVEAMKRGAADYLPKPFTPAQMAIVTQRVARVRALEQKVASLQGAGAETSAEVTLTTRDAALQRTLDMARDVAQSDAAILIRGESGAGKGVLAAAIHGWSPRRERPFAIVSCPSLSAQLLESELFGHVRGAFTGAVRDNPGRLAMCEGGTLFLDEIGDLPLELQPKLLRFLHDRSYERIGDAVTRQADVRVITATNANLEQLVQTQRFREDLLYRINVVQLDLPALRDRRDDIAPLAEQMLASLRRTRPIAGFTAEALEMMRQYAWPGNLRELRNVIERAVILCKSGEIGTELLPATLSQSRPDARPGDLLPLAKIEEMHIRRVLAATKSLDDAAAVLGIDVATLWRRRKKYGI